MTIYRPVCYGEVYYTEKYVLSVSMDSYHSSFVSTQGHHAFTANPVSLEWIGFNLRKSMLTAKQFRFKPEDWDQDAFEKFRDASFAIWLNILTSIKSEFKYRSKESAFSKALMVTAMWPRDGCNPIEIYASNRKQGCVYEALANRGKRPDNFRQVSMDASDSELGQVVIEMLAVSTLSGRRVTTPNRI